MIKQHKTAATVLALLGAVAIAVSILCSVYVEHLSVAALLAVFFGIALLVSAVGIHLYHPWAVTLATRLSWLAVAVGSFTAIRLVIELCTYRPPVAVLFGYISPHLETSLLLILVLIGLLTFTLLGRSLTRLRTVYPQ
jgi:hypothetical protein